MSELRLYANTTINGTADIPSIVYTGSNNLKSTLVGDHDNPAGKSLAYDVADSDTFLNIFQAPITQGGVTVLLPNPEHYEGRVIEVFDMAGSAVAASNHHHITIAYLATGETESTAITEISANYGLVKVFALHDRWYALDLGAFANTAF